MAETQQTTVYSLKHVEYGSGNFGKLWREMLFYDKERAERHMTILVHRYNDREIAKDRSHDVYKKGTLYNKSG